MPTSTAFRPANFWEVLKRRRTHHRIYNAVRRNEDEIAIASKAQRLRRSIEVRSLFNADLMTPDTNTKHTACPFLPIRMGDIGAGWLAAIAAAAGRNPSCFLHFVSILLTLPTTLFSLLSKPAHTPISPCCLKHRLLSSNLNLRFLRSLARRSGRFFFFTEKET